MLQKSDFFLKKCLQLAERGRGFVSPNPVVGAVLVRNGKIIAEDFHRKYGEGHAERNLLEKFKGKVLPSDILLVTLEPCCHTDKKTPPCTEIILEKGVKNVVVGMLDPNPKVNGKGVEMLRQKGVSVSRFFPFRPTPQSASADTEEWRNPLFWQNRFYVKWITQKEPWVALKVAESLDGRISFDRKNRFQLTGKEAFRHAHEMRKQFDAILIGINTVMVDNPRLQESKFAVVLDTNLKIPFMSHLVRSNTIIFCSEKASHLKKEKLRHRGIQVLQAPCDSKGFLDLHVILSKLGSLGISSVLIEGGLSIWSSFLRENLVDELMIYLAPKMLGQGVKTFDDDLPFTARKLNFREMKILGDDLFWNGVF